MDTPAGVFGCNYDPQSIATVQVDVFNGVLKVQSRGFLLRERERERDSEQQLKLDISRLSKYRSCIGGLYYTTT